MDAANDIAEFLTTRRARITPEQAGLPSYGKRRVPGLRREEVASLAGVSVEYYKRLERGNVSGVSELVLEGLASALQLDDAERAHLFDLARAASPVAPEAPAAGQDSASARSCSASSTRSRRRRSSARHGDYLAANALGRALYAPVFDSPEQPANSARFTFLDPAAPDFYPEWDRLASELVASLRSQAGRNPYDRNLQDLIGELSTRSEEFRVRWAAHNVRFHRTGSKRLHHPVVGELELSYETLTLDADDGLRLGALHRRARLGLPAGAGPAGQLGRRPPRPRRVAHHLDPRGPRTMTPATTPALTLNNGVEMPALGLGVFQSPPEETTAAVETALRDGYRHIDTAAAYGNEREVGDAVRASGLDRSEVFLETKIWISDYGYDETLHGVREERGQARRRADRPADPPPGAALGVRPHARGLPRAGDAAGRRQGPRDRRQQLHGRPPHPAARRSATVVPAVNQIEVHPYFVQPEVQAFGAEHGILTQAWSPIGGITFYRDGEHTSTLEDPVIVEIAEAHGKSPAQVMLRWGLQHGRSVIPKSTKPERIAENIDVFDFELTADEMAAIDGLDTGRRGGPEPEAITLEAFGRDIPEA